MSSREQDSAHPTPSATAFFNAYWTALATRGWEAVVLHSWQDLPEMIVSDIDYAVRGPTPDELLSFLAAHARQHSWRLVQIIEHEPGAIFCVCQQVAPPFEALQLDVTWSYRRLGHPLLPADVIFEDHRAVPDKTFRVPSPASEFCYLLAKAAAKGKGFGAVGGRLATLLEEDPEGCPTLASRAFGAVPEKGASIDSWKSWFTTAPAFAAVRRGRLFGARECALYLRRMVQPTGFHLHLNMAAENPDVLRVADTLRPSFREMVIGGTWGRLDCLRLLLHLIRTGLVIEPNNASQGRDESVDEAIIRAITMLSDRVDHRLAVACSGKK